MKAAIVAIEDRRFYQHNGVDWQGTIRAVMANSASGDVVQGASTLTQQYVKNYFLYVTAKTETERLKATEQTSARKLKEAQIALQMERALSKEEILTRYLNIVSFGNGAAGVAAAARTYFNTTPGQADGGRRRRCWRAWCATSPPPTRSRKPQAALERRNVVIEQMRDQQMIDERQAKAALASPLGIANPLVTQPARVHRRGRRRVLLQVRRRATCCEAGFTNDQLNRGGYTIKTTLDPNVLAKMKASLNQQVPAGPAERRGHDVGGGAGRGQAPGAGDGAPAGCSAWTAARCRPATGCPTSRSTWARAPPTRSSPRRRPWRRAWASTTCSRCRRRGYASPIYVDGGGRPIPVQNAGDYAEQMSLQDALATSPNTAFIKLEEFTGVPDVVDMAVRLGMKSLATTPFVDPNTRRRTDRSIAQVTKDQRQASFTLGVSPTSVLELANVGATLASAGRWCPPSPIESVTEQDGKPVAGQGGARASRRSSPGWPTR